MAVQRRARARTLRAKMPRVIKPAEPATTRPRRSGSALATVHGRILWWVGDWLAFGERAKWGEVYDEAKELFGFEYATLRQAAWVSRSVQLSSRLDKLTWGHHLEVAALDPKHQSRWLANRGNGVFGKWVEQRCGIGRSTAQNYMRVSEVFGGKVCATVVQTFDNRAMYLLAAPSVGAGNCLPMAGRVMVETGNQGRTIRP